MNTHFAFRHALRQLILIYCVLISSASMSAAEAPSSKSARVFVLLLMDTDTDTIGDMVAVDAKYLHSRFKDAAKKDSRITLTYLDGKHVTPDRVRSYFKYLHADSSSSIVVIYDGHGGEDKNGKHVLAGKYGWLNRSDVWDMISIANPRLGVLYTSSCGGSNGARAKDMTIDRAAMQQLDSFRVDSLEDLFFRSTGFVDINSSKPGIFSWLTKEGSLGVYAFASLLSDRLDNVDNIRPDGFVDWKEATAYLQQATNRYTKVKNDGSLVTLLNDVQAASPMLRHKPDPLLAWRIGIQVSTHWSGVGVMVQSVEPNSPAAAAGIRKLDRIVSIDGMPIQNSWHDFSRAIRNADYKAEFVVERIVKLGEYAQEAQLERIQMRIPVVRDTVKRSYVSSSSNSTSFDVTTYFEQLYRGYSDRLHNPRGGNYYERASPEELHKYAWLLLRCPTAPKWGDPEHPVVWGPSQSLNACRVACSMTSWEQPHYIATLAAAYAATGQFESAVKYQQVACKQAAAEDKAEFARRLKLYANGQRFCEPY